MARKKDNSDDIEDDVINEAAQEKAESHRAEILENQNIINSYILKEVGRPDNFLSINTIHLFKNRYRVNIWVSDDKGPCISDSYFVKLVADGVVSETPITLKYPKKGKPA